MQCTWLKMVGENKETIMDDESLGHFCYESIVCVSGQLDSSGLPFPKWNCSNISYFP